MPVKNLRQKRKKPLMTVASAIICQDAIIVATDSRTTEEAAVRDDTIKSEIVSRNGWHAIVAVSGNAEMGNILLEQFSLSPFVDILHPRDALDHAILQFKRDFMRKAFSAKAADFYKKCKMAQAELSFSVLMACYDKSQPAIYEASIPFFAANKRNYRHYSIGCGKDVANYLLKPFDFSEMTSHRATLAAIWAVNEVKKADPRCGGDVQVILVSAGEKPERLTNNAILAMEMELLKDEPEQAKRREEIAKKIMGQTSLTPYNPGTDDPSDPEGE